jgi:3-oxoacyl-(acyl-carrier-protein) synthase
VITGYGVVTAWGSGIAPAWEALEAGRPAGRDWQPEGEQQSWFAAALPETYRRNPAIPANLAHFLDRGSLIALDAAFQALESAGLGAGAGDARRFALADGLAYRAPGQGALYVPYGHVVARALGVRGPVVVAGGGDASGMAAIAAGARLIGEGRADVVLAGAAQSLQRPLLEHLASQGWMANEARPFDAGHAGMAPGEGAACLVLEADEHARGRGAAVAAKIAGIGEVFDPGAEPLAVSEGPEAGRAVQAALTNAGYLQNQVDLVVSCADGRPAVDLADGDGIRRTFGRHATYAAVTAPAGSLGNTLAAGGPLAVAVALEAMARQRVPPIAGLDSPVAGMDLAYARPARDERVDCVLVTWLGLGGVNVSMVLRR